MLDSGAEYIVLIPRAAAKCRFAGDAGTLNLVGAGTHATENTRRVQAQSIELDGLTLRGEPVLIVSHTLGDGIDGVLPLAVFRDFLIRLDFRDQTLDLLKYPDPSGDSIGLRALSSNSLLFLKGSVNGVREGYFLIDTGASYSAISQGVARELHIVEALAPRAPMQGGTALVDGPLIESGLQLRLGDQRFWTGPTVAIDLSTMSRYHGLDVDGLIGFRALAESIMTVSYRECLVRIEPAVSRNHSEQAAR
jgi:hypothetical protein